MYGDVEYDFDGVEVVAEFVDTDDAWVDTEAIVVGTGPLDNKDVDAVCCGVGVCLCELELAEAGDVVAAAVNGTGFAVDVAKMGTRLGTPKIIALL